jgi:glycosyltransferase involved in cell wall biosynthesis
MGKNICFFNSNLEWGGGEKWHLGAAKELIKRGYSVHLFTSKNSKLYEEALRNNIRVSTVRLRNLSFLNLFKVLKLSFMLRKHNFSAIIMNLPADVKAAGIASKLVGIEKIIYRRGMPHPIKNSLINRLVFGKVLTNVIANSQTVKESITVKNQNIIEKEKIVVINNSINFENYKSLSEEKVYEKKVGEIVIGNVGRLVEQKGQKYLIELADELRKRKVDFKILIAGSGPLEQELKDYSQKLKVESYVLFVGFISNVKAFMNSIDVFVLPSLFEGSPNTILEAMSFGKPIITHNTGSMAELIEDGVNGYTFTIGNINDCADKIEFLQNNNALYNTISDQNITEIKTKYSTEKKINELIALF